ncbi:MAG TPA: hypothetical protein VHY08_23065, partial [Bacillota bacterium]|nr:hypothetical protein [Bacillota bacterium]
MKHLLFFYLTLSYSIGFFSLVVLILAYLKSWWKVLKYIIIFLLIGTIQLIFLTYVEYQYANIPIWFNLWYAVINYGLESLNIIVFPLLINELFNIPKRRLMNYLWGVLSLVGLACIVIPFLLGVLNNGTQLETLISYKIFRLIFSGAYVYSFIIAGLKIKTISDRKERNFYLYSLVILFILALQTVVPFIKTFPENLFVFATGYFTSNVLFIKYLVGRFFPFSQPPLKENLDQVVTP